MRNFGKKEPDHRFCRFCSKTTLLSCCIQVFLGRRPSKAPRASGCITFSLLLNIGSCTSNVRGAIRSCTSNNDCFFIILVVLFLLVGVSSLVVVVSSLSLFSADDDAQMTAAVTDKTTTMSIIMDDELDDVDGVVMEDTKFYVPK